MVNTTGVLFSIAISSLLILVTAATSPLVTSYLLAVYRWITLLLLIPAVCVVIQAVERRRPMAVGIMFGYGLILASGIHDILVSMWVIESDVYIATHAFLGFVLVQGYLVARRNARYAHALRTATKAAHAATLAKDQFLTAVSHEIRTPLTAISGYAQILQEELTPHSESHQHNFLQTIRDSSDRVLGLVNDLLDLAKVESGKLDLNLTAVSVNTVVADVVRQLFPLADNKGLVLTASHQDSALWVRADVLRLHQVLINLVSNAIKFTEAGGVTIHSAATSVNEQPACAIVIEDTGAGISPDFLPRLFDRFTQEARVYTDTQRGTGLGLALSSELVSGMGGDITVASEVGVGSRFTITLLRTTPPALAEKAPIASNRWNGPSLHSQPSVEL